MPARPVGSSLCRAAYTLFVATGVGAYYRAQRRLYGRQASVCAEGLLAPGRARRRRGAKVLA